MKITKPKIFVSYTVADGVITFDILLEIEKLLFGISNTFIDLLHNDSINKQSRVMFELKKSDLVLLIKTKEIYNSEWVKKEISFAQEINIPIIEIDFQKLINIDQNTLFQTIASAIN